MLYDYELFKKGKHYIRLETQGKYNQVMKELDKLGFNWVSGKGTYETPNYWPEHRSKTMIAYDGNYGGFFYNYIENHDYKYLEELLPLEKGENKMTNQGMNIKKLYDEIDKIYFNEKKRTTVIKFKDGSTVKATASEHTDFCEYAGFTAALMKSKYGKLENITRLIERKKS